MHKSLLIALAVALVFPLVAFASDGGAAGHVDGPGLASLGWPILNFLIFLFIVNFLYRKKAAPLLAERSREIQSFIQKASSDLAAVEREISVVRARLSSIEQEKNSIIHQLTAEGEQIAKAILESTHNEARKLEGDAARHREHEITRANSELRAELIRKAMGLARTHLRGKVTGQDDRRLRDEVLGSFLG